MAPVHQDTAETNFVIRGNGLHTEGITGMQVYSSSALQFYFRPIEKVQKFISCVVGGGKGPVWSDLFVLLIMMSGAE